MAGFEMTTYGRFWATAKGKATRRTVADAVDLVARDWTAKEMQTPTVSLLAQHLQKPVDLTVCSP
jgi:hypothetical protein